MESSAVPPGGAPHLLFTNVPPGSSTVMVMRGGEASVTDPPAVTIWPIVARTITVVRADCAMP